MNYMNMKLVKVNGKTQSLDIFFLCGNYPPHGLNDLFQSL